MRRYLFAWCLAAWACSVAQAVSVKVTVIPDGDNQSLVTLTADVQQTPAALWNVLTDYDHLSEILPYMSKSRVIEQTAEHKVVEQEGHIQIMFWTFTMRVKHDVHETPTSHIHFEAIEGDFARLTGDWDLKLLGINPETTALSCQFVVKPRRRVPGWAVRLAARHYLAAMVRALADHAERGHA